MPNVKSETTKIFLEFAFTQEERDNVLKYCSLSEDIIKHFRKMVTAGADIVIMFDKHEANEMMKSLLEATVSVSEKADLKNMFEDLHERFEETYNNVFHR